MPRAPMPSTQVLFDAFALRGGLDLHTPQLSLRPGVARGAENFECSINGGYTRIPGYERYDGRPSPSGATYATMTVSALGTLAVGDAINGQTSGATGTVAALDVASKLVVYTKAAGTFTAGENVRKVAVVQGTAVTVGVAITDQVAAATYQLAAANIYRADIATVPGSGSVLGVFAYNANVYALRNNGGGTAAALYRSSGTGWVAIPFGYELSFTAGSGTAPAEGATITKGAVSAVVRRVALESGTWASSTAAGRFIIDVPTGGNFSAGAFTAGVTATCSGVQTAVTLLPGGRFEVDTGNAGNGVRVYGCDGVNRGWEFDGAVFVPLNSGQPSDRPSHVKVHKRYLFFSFVSSAQYSGIGTPYQWTALSGSAELAVNEPITAFLVLPGNASAAALGIMGNDSVSILYGTGPSSWNLVDTNSGVGCKAYAAQALNQSYIFDDLGVVVLEAVQQYGNFAANSLTVNLRQFVQSRRTLVTASLINREKSQYRVYFSDGYGLYCTIVNGRFSGAIPVNFPAPVRVACSGESTNGGEVSYFGSTDGYVYRMDAGTSFDGNPINWSLDLAFAAQGNARVRKRYRKAVFELQGEGYSQFSAGYSLAYGDEAVVSTVVPVTVNPVYWDQFTWDQFTWDGRAIAPSQLSMDGAGENVSIRVEGNSALYSQFTINSVTLHYTPRRIIR